MTIDLRSPDLRKVVVGTTVITSKGFKFKLVSRKNGKETWQDLTTKLKWFDKEDKKYTFDDAVKKFGDQLPSKIECEVAEVHGFREVLPNIKDNYFWSASVYSYDRQYAWVFNEDSGFVRSYNRSYGLGVRCVGR
jgi:hypothetical protein